MCGVDGVWVWHTSSNISMEELQKSTTSRAIHYTFLMPKIPLVDSSIYLVGHGWTMGTVCFLIFTWGQMPIEKQDDYPITVTKTNFQKPLACFAILQWNTWAPAYLMPNNPNLLPQWSYATYLVDHGIPESKQWPKKSINWWKKKTARAAIKSINWKK